VLVPVGSTEQHGPHLPLDVDTVIAVSVCERVSSMRAGALVAPAVAFGSSGEHQAFPGTISIGTPVLRELLTELGRSLGEWARQIQFVNGHGGNVEALTAAVRVLRDEGRRVGWSACRHGDAHAGRRETSLMLHLAPERVAREAIAPGNTTELRALLPSLREHGVRSVSPNGVLGDPRGATAEEGRRILAEMVAQVSSEVDLLERNVAHVAVR
jgi:creatinine amidohydrolase